VSDLAPRLPIRSILKGFLRPATLDKFTHWHQGSLVRSLPGFRWVPSLWRARVTGVPRVKAWLRSSIATVLPGK
jgi:hypothetical protein